MDVDPPLQQQIRELVNALVAADYPTLCAEGWLGRLRQDEVQLRLHEYGATLVAPPQAFIDSIERYAYQDGSGLHLDVPLWTAEEGLSDLTLSLQVLFEDDRPQLQMLDLHVL